MEHVNVYDWDKTIFPLDSTAAFILWCFRRHPLRMLRILRVVPVLPGYFLHRVSKTRMKEKLYGFLRGIPDIDAEVSAFWDANFHRIHKWYLAQKRPDDIVISASPEFLIRPACAKLGISCVIGSPVDKRTGLFLGPNCHGREKVSRFRARFPGGGIDEFFSDSRSDEPLAKLAKQAWIVKGEKLVKW